MRISTLFLLVTLLVGLALTSGAAAQVTFAVRAGGTGNDGSAGVAPDGDGGAFVFGSFTGEADFDGDGTFDLIVASDPFSAGSTEPDALSTSARRTTSP